jgi:hypothetical protein
MRPQQFATPADDAYVRRNFTSYNSERKRAHHHLGQTLDQARKSGISAEVMAAALLDTAAGMMLAKGGPRKALASLESTLHRVVMLGFE